MAEFPIIGSGFVGKQYAYPFRRRKVWKTDIVRFDSNLEQRNETWSLPLRFWGVQWRLLSEAQRGKLVELFDAGRGSARPLYLEDPLDYSATCTYTQTARAITTADQTDDYFAFEGLYASKWKVGHKFKVINSTGNNGVYTVDRVAQDDTHTFLYVTTAIADSTADGQILRLSFQAYVTYYSGEDYSWDEPKKDIQPGQCTVSVGEPPVEQVEDTDYTLSDTEGIVVFVEDSLEETRITLNFFEPGVLWFQEIKRISTEA